jgi:hypothetical protein
MQPSRMTRLAMAVMEASHATIIQAAREGHHRHGRGAVACAVVPKALNTVDVSIVFLPRQYFEHQLDEDPGNDVFTSICRAINHYAPDDEFILVVSTDGAGFHVTIHKFAEGPN